MATYTYAGKNKQGAEKKGELTAKSLEEAKAQLVGQGITISSMQEKKSWMDFQLGGNPAIR